MTDLLDCQAGVLAAIAEDERWPATWAAACAAIEITGEHRQAEQLARRACRKFRMSPAPPGLPAARRAAARLAASAQAIAEDLETLRAAAASTPHPGRRAVFDCWYDDALAALNLQPLNRTGWASIMFGWPEAARDLASLAEASRTQTLPPAPPRAPSVTFDVLVEEWGIAYESLTGRRPSAVGSTNPDAAPPPFVRFLHELWPATSSTASPSRRRVFLALRRSEHFRGSAKGQYDRMASRADSGTVAP